MQIRDHLVAHHTPEPGGIQREATFVRVSLDSKGWQEGDDDVALGTFGTSRTARWCP